MRLTSSASAPSVRRHMSAFTSVSQTERLLAQQDYIADPGLATVLFLSMKMGRPLFLEGAPGVGKTELARVVSKVLDTELIRLQCYEGLDISQAAYEWNYPRQLLHMQGRGQQAMDAEDLYSTKFLLQRPLLRSIDPERTRAPVLLIDELDRADEEFESFLLELLSEFQMTIPELGTIEAAHRPTVILTSNRTREVHEALKRRCLYHWLEYPSQSDEREILRRKVPEVSKQLCRDVAAFSADLRTRELAKAPGVAESIDWLLALRHLDAQELNEGNVLATAGALLKSREDLERLKGSLLVQLLANSQQLSAETAT